MRNIRSLATPWMCSAAVLLATSALGCSSGNGDSNAILRPTVDAVAPVNFATGVSTTSPVITATFSEQMAPITGSSTFTVVSDTSVVVSGTVALDSTKRIATFTLEPSTSLLPLTRYTATVSGATSNTTGRAIQSNYVWVFTTGTAPAAIDVPAEQ